LLGRRPDGEEGAEEAVRAAEEEEVVRIGIALWVEGRGRVFVGVSVPQCIQNLRCSSALFLHLGQRSPAAPFFFWRRYLPTSRGRCGATWSNRTARTTSSTFKLSTPRITCANATGTGTGAITT